MQRQSDRVRFLSFQALGWHEGPRKGLKRAPRISLFKVRDAFVPTPDRLNGMSLFIFSLALFPWFYSRTRRSGFIFWEKWCFHLYSEGVRKEKQTNKQKLLSRGNHQWNISRNFPRPDGKLSTLNRTISTKWMKNYPHQGRSLWNFRTLGTERKDLKEKCCFQTRKTEIRMVSCFSIATFFFLKAIEQYFQNSEGKQFST